MTITVKKSGLLSTIQDLGRYGSQKYGVIASGAMDTLSHRISNMLVGNHEHEAAIEMTLLGAHFEFQKDSLISICGADMSPVLNDKLVRMWRPILVKKGSILTFSSAKHGCRAYLAVAGGFDVPEVMDSKSTYLRAGIGGFNGRALKNGDILSIGEMSSQAKKQLDAAPSFSELDWSVSSEFFPIQQEERHIRVIKGRQFDDFSEESKVNFFTERFEITPQSDRMGYRMKGPVLKLEKEAEMISEAVSFGTIQVPSEGNPIVLLADRQTTGGYPKIAQIASVDLPFISQLKPGESVQFIEISLDEAQQLFLDREKKIQQLKLGLLLKTS